MICYIQDDDFIKSARSEIQKAMNGQDTYDEVEDWALKLEMVLDQSAQYKKQ